MSDEEWIELDRLREIISEIESLGMDGLTQSDLLNRRGIEDDELAVLPTLRLLARRGGNRTVIPGLNTGQLPKPT